MIRREWGLHEAKHWLMSQCLAARKETPDRSFVRIKLQQPPSDDRPPDLLIWEAFELLVSQGAITGYPVIPDNTGPIPIMINGVALTPQAIERMEETEESDIDEIGFKTSA